MSDELEAPWWLAAEPDAWPRAPWSGEAAPFLLEPPGEPDAGGFDASITKIRSNLTNNAETIAQVPADVVKGAVSGYNTVIGWFSDPSGPPKQQPPPVPPEQIQWLPQPDPFLTYSGLSPEPTWKDVYDWQHQTWVQEAPELAMPQPIMGPQIQHAIEAASGQTIKALSGFINRSANLAILAADVLAQRIADTQTVIGALNDNQVIVNDQVHAILDPIVNEVLPQLQADVQQLHNQIIGTAEGVVKLNQVWARENIFTPLEEQLGQEKANRIAQVDQVEQGLAGRVVGIVEGLGLASATAVAGLATRVAALETENEECTKPMCDTLGPKTDLGKLLKGLNLALDAAFIAKILTMRESDIADLFRQAFGKVAGIVNDFEETFQPGGETVGGFIKNTIGNAV